MSWRKRDNTQIIENEAELVAQELYNKNLDLAHTNQTLSLLRTIDGLVLDPENTVEQMIQGIADSVVSNSSYLFSIIFVNDVHDGSLMKTGGFALANIESSSSSELLQEIPDLRLLETRPWFQSHALSTVLDIRDVGDNLIEDSFGHNKGHIADLLASTGAKSVCLIKLMVQGGLSGVMFVGLADEASLVKIERLEQLGRVGEATGIALDNKLLSLKYQKVLSQLKKSNDKLLALDQAKDEFVSMASHQLRTPLTSIKGYLSMVLEGDAGTITEMQEKMLGQAFFSSQRMVYLISDLLNVSRLKTGKFIIDAKPVNLAEVVDSELDQLHNGAESKNLTLMYTKPKDFPVVNLDEMKIRQVIMNFVDNAIYYTPSGGKIIIELKDLPSSIELRVRDTGIGVPKEQQHKLFTKFYRADNARKTRPDGTGLGLFMAKKVIIAQGGSLIFESKEGKGSTFGFNFSKERLASGVQEPVDLTDDDQQAEVPQD